MCTAMETFLFKAECRSLTYPEYRANFPEIFATIEDNEDDIVETEMDYDFDPILFVDEVVAACQSKDRDKARFRRKNIQRDKATYLYRKSHKSNAGLRKGIKKQSIRSLRNGKGYDNYKSLRNGIRKTIIHNGDVDFIDYGNIIEHKGISKEPVFYI